MWKIAQIEPATTWPTMPNGVAMAPSSAINRNSSSPAYILPNSRMPSDTVRAAYSIKFNRKLNGASQMPNGAANSSWIQPPMPLTLTL